MLIFFTIILSVSETSWLFSLCSVPTVVSAVCVCSTATPADVQSDVESNTKKCFCTESTKKRMKTKLIFH